MNAIKTAVDYAPSTDASAYAIRWETLSKVSKVERYTSAAAARAALLAEEAAAAAGGIAPQLVSSEDDLADTGMAQLVAIFNHCYRDTPLSRFENVATGRRRTWKAVRERWAHLEPSDIKEKTVTVTETAKPAAAPKAPKAAAAPKAPKAAAPKAPKAAAPKGEPRVVGKPAKAEITQMRDGTRRQKILALMDGTKTLSEIAAAVGAEPGLTNSHIHCIWRDCGVGYGEADGKVVAHYPAGHSYHTVVKAAEKA